MSFTPASGEGEPLGQQLPQWDLEKEKGRLTTFPRETGRKSPLGPMCLSNGQSKPARPGLGEASQLLGHKI